MPLQLRAGDCPPKYGPEIFIKFYGGYIIPVGRVLACWAAIIFPSEINFRCSMDLVIL